MVIPWYCFNIISKCKESPLVFGYVENSDVNGSLNILRKVIGDDFIRKLCATTIKNEYSYERKFSIVGLLVYFILGI